MRFRIISDIHNEHQRYHFGMNYHLPEHESDGKSTLIIAGDFGQLIDQRSYACAINDLCRRFKYVFWIEGNHEFYYGNINDSIKNCLKIPNLYSNKLVLEREKIAVIGRTLWTDYNNENPIDIVNCQRMMNDFNLITTDKKNEYGYHYKITPEQIIAIHIKQKQDIVNDCKYYKSKGFTVIVVSHHHPSRKGISSAYINHPANSAFVNDMDELIMDLDCRYWICGHIHTAIDYKIGNCQVICNPLGYPHEQNNGFDCYKYIEV